MKKRYFLLLIFSFCSFFLYQAFLIPPDHEGENSSEFQHKDTHIQESQPMMRFGLPVDDMIVVDTAFRPNENLAEILYRYNVSAATVAEIGHLPKETFDVKRLRAYKPYTIIHYPDSAQTARYFVYQPNPVDYLILDFGDTLGVIQGHYPVDTVVQTLAGTINTSLYESMLEAGGNPLLVNKLADVYAWEVDFFGLQGGDCYKMVYNTYYVNGEPAGFGKILTASFTHMGEETFAYCFDQGEGDEYFDEEGNSLRKTFLRAPLQFSRISSRFSYSRMHPVLRYRRPHLGIDYAAPRGTPVQTVGDGVVIKSGYSGGAGHMIKIRHNSNFTTAYLHLSRYAKGIRPGKFVKQGEIIGYVGSTGLSTGPHLDFRFYKNGVPVDPLKVDPPSSNPVTPDCMADYMNTKKRLSVYLDEMDQREEMMIANYLQANPSLTLN